MKDKQNKDEKELRDCVEYCRQQNGIDRCKNCGLDDEMISNIIESAQQQGRDYAVNIIKYGLPIGIQHAWKFETQQALFNKARNNNK